MKILAFLFVSLFAAMDQDLEEIRVWVKKKMEEFPEPDFEVKTSLEELDTFQKEREKELIALVETADKKEIFDGDEREFHPEILENPLKEIGAIPSEEIPKQEETILKTCRESGEFEREILETLKVSFLATQKIKQCLGHSSMQEIKGNDDRSRKKKVNQKMATLRASYENTPNIQKNYKVEISDSNKFKCNIKTHYYHIDNSENCDRYQTIKNTKEHDEWTTDAPEELTLLKENPNCKVIVEILEGPEERDIEGKKVFRDIWARKLLFECSPSQDSPCETYRKAHAMLVKRKCLKANDETGDCELWEKTYDLGKIYAPEARVEFEKGKHPIWGLNGEFTPSPQPKKSDFQTVLGIMKSLSDMPLGEGNALFDLDEKMKIFNAKVYQCSKNHKMNETYDCCRKMNSCFCNEEEEELQKLRQEERCHYVGHYYESLFKQVKVYCCFPTKLLRMFTEKAKKQLGIGWGKAKKPNCGGFSLEELEGKLDVSQMDFSEASDELQIDEAKVSKEIAEAIRKSFESNEIKNMFLGEPDANP